MAIPWEEPRIIDAGINLKQWFTLSAEQIVALKKFLQEWAHEDASKQIRALLQELPIKVAEIPSGTRDDSSRDIWRSGVDWMWPIDLMEMLSRISKWKYISIEEAKIVLENCDKFFQASWYLAKQWTYIDSIIEKLTWKNLPEALAWVLAWMIVKWDDTKRDIIKDELKIFLQDEFFNNPWHRGLIVDIFNSKTLIDFAKNLEVILISLWKINYEDGTKEIQEKGHISFLDFTNAIWAIYVDPKISPILLPLLQSYNSGRLKNLKAYIESKQPENIKQSQTAIIQDPEQLFIKGMVKMITSERFMQSITKVWVLLRSITDEAKSGRPIPRDKVELMAQELLAGTQDLRTGLETFFKKNPQAWENFKKDGVIIKGFVIFTEIFWQWSSINRTKDASYLTSQKFFDTFFQKESISLVLLLIFQQIFNQMKPSVIFPWARHSPQRDLNRYLESHWVRFWMLIFVQMLWIALKDTQSAKIIIDASSELLSMIQDGKVESSDFIKKYKELMERVKVLFPKISE